MINVIDPFGNTPLHIAIAYGKSESLIYLLDRGADSTIKNKEMIAPIHQCILSNQPVLLDMFLSHPSKPDIHYGGENGGTALHYCTFFDNLECANVLFKHNVDIFRTCKSGRQAIHVAAEHSSLRMLELLIKKGIRF